MPNHQPIIPPELRSEKEKKLLAKRERNETMLTPWMLNELIEKREVFNAETIDSVWEQRLRIHFNCVGIIEIPKALPLLVPDVTVNTRKGIYVNSAEMTKLAV